MSGPFTQNNYNANGAGALVAKQAYGTECELFHEKADQSLFQQQWFKYLPFQRVAIVQHFQNSGLSRNNVVSLNRTPDILSNCYLMGHFPAIVANQDHGVVDCHWVNAVAFYVIQQLTFKIGSQPLFQNDGIFMMWLATLTGQLPHIASNIGYRTNTQSLLDDAKTAQNFYAPFIGMPFHDRAETGFTVGPINFHQIQCEVMTRPLSQIVVNITDADSNTGLNSIPYEVRTGAILNANSVEFSLATNYIYLSDLEKIAIGKSNNECVFKEYKVAGQFQIPSNAASSKIDMEIDMNGPTFFMVVTIQSNDDLAKNNWTKLCADDGKDYITEMMLITGSTPREDGLPAEAYRTLKVVETFKNSVKHHIYVLSMELNDTDSQMTGHANMTNVEKKKFSAVYKPHASPLTVTVYYGSYNGWWVRGGSGGRVWG